MTRVIYYIDMWFLKHIRNFIPIVLYESFCTFAEIYFFNNILAVIEIDAKFVGIITEKLREGGKL